MLRNILTFELRKLASLPSNQSEGQLVRVLRALSVRSYVTGDKEPDVPRPEQTPVAPPQEPEVPKIDRSRPLPPPAYAGSRLGYMSTAEEKGHPDLRGDTDSRSSDHVQSGKGQNLVDDRKRERLTMQDKEVERSDEVKGETMDNIEKERDLAKMRSLGLDKPEGELYRDQ